MKTTEHTAHPGTTSANALVISGDHELIPLQAALSLAVSQLLLAGLFAMMLWTAVAHNALIIWLGLALLLVVLDVLTRFMLVPKYGHTGRWRHWITTLDVCTGLLWLYAALFFYPASREDLQFFYLFGLGAPALCAAVYQHYHLPGCFARIGLALPIAALYFLDGDEPYSKAQAFVVFSIWASFIWLAKRLHQLLIQRLKLTRNRDALLKKVAIDTRELAELQAKEADSRQVAESANLAKSRFLAHSSHDLRQPLHAISLLLETVDEDELDSTNGHVIARVRQSVELLAQLFDSLLDLTLLDTGQVKISAMVFNLDHVFDDIASDFASVAAANGVTIVANPSRLYVRADPTITRRMIQNLVANAIRHAPNGTVTLRAHCASESVSIDVADNGSGIALEDQKRIFEEFTKLDVPPNERSANTLGLGLAIVNRLAHLTGATVSVVSEPDRGSVFTLGPFELSSSTDEPTDAKLTPTPDLKSVQVVVIDDDRDTLRATGGLLAKWGFAVTLLENGRPEEIVKPNVLICDYELGHQHTGIDLIRGVRKHYGEIVPALLISGNTSPELMELAANEDLRLLRKPVRPAQLKSAILTLLGTASKQKK